MLSTDNDKSVTSPVSVTHRAGWVVAAPDQIIENGYVTTVSGKITDVGRDRAGGSFGQTTDHGPGVLMPCLVNAHTHLELSALHHKTCIRGGLISWVKSLIEARDALDAQDIAKGIGSGIKALEGSGTLVIGDISGAGISREAVCDSRLSGVWFREYLGADSETIAPCEKIRADQAVSVAGHAPHTTASELLVRLKKATRAAGLPFSLHLAESAEEIEFLATGKGRWRDFLTERGLDPAVIQSTGKSPVDYAHGLGLLDETTLAVHLVFAYKNDIHLLRDRNVSVCLCPRSNQMLHHRLPDVPAMLAAGLKLCLGTDSLASNDSLSLFDEMRFLREAFPGISPGLILSMATVGGAAALGFADRFGRLARGFAARMIYVPVNAATPENVLQSLVNGDFAGNVESIY